MLSENLKNLIYILEKILDFKHILPEGQDWVETYCGKVSTGHISGGDFDLVLKKIGSEGIANFETRMGNSAMGWGSDKLIITEIDWDKLEQYLCGLKQESGDILNKSIQKQSIEVDEDRKDNQDKLDIKGSAKNSWRKIWCIKYVWSIIKFIWKHKIISGFATFIAILSFIIFTPFFSNDCSIWSGYIIKSCSIQQATAEAELEISNIFIDYFDENKFQIEELDINSEVNLDKVNGLLIYFELKNINDPTLVFTVNKISIKTSKGHLIEDYAPDDFGSKVLTKDTGMILRYTKAIDSTFLLNQLRENYNFKIIIEPDIIYFKKDKPEEIRFDSTIQCNNNLNKELLPKFKAACNVAYVED